MLNASHPRGASDSRTSRESRPRSADALASPRPPAPRPSYSSPASRNARRNSAAGARLTSIQSRAFAAAGSSRCRVSNAGRQASTSTSAAHNERTRTNPDRSPLRHSPREKTSSVADGTRAHASSRTSRSSVSRQFSSPSGRPPGRSQDRPSSETRTTSPSTVRHTPADPCATPIGTALGGCHEASQSSAPARNGIGSPSTAGGGSRSSFITSATIAQRSGPRGANPHRSQFASRTLRTLSRCMSSEPRGTSITASPR